MPSVPITAQRRPKRVSACAVHHALLVADAIRGTENNDGKAIAIERAVAYQHDPKAVNSSVSRLQVVTVADVQRVMKKYFSDNNRVVIYYSGENSK